VVGISGASGAVLARPAVDWLLGRGQTVWLTASVSARLVWQDELGKTLKSQLEAWEKGGGFGHWGPDDYNAPMASGSRATAGMLVIPCSMGTLSAIAVGASQNLLQRAADVTLKEGRRLVLVPRESPLSPIHLRNLLTLAELGARIVPPMPPFYLPLRRMDDVVDYAARRALDALGFSDALEEGQRWRGPGLGAG
jgi:4-hydroxy-3-polyprenylbenzoate decarboxylase